MEPPEGEDVEALKAFCEKIQEQRDRAAEIADNIFPIDFHIYEIKWEENGCMRVGVETVWQVRVNGQSEKKPWQLSGEDVLQMPECVYNRVEVSMSEKEMALYEQLERDMLLPFSDGDIDAVNAAALANKLLQMADGAVYDENGNVKHIHDRKLEALDDLIEAANGKPVSQKMFRAI